MRIVLICNCLEPGRDGVGDYTGRIGTQLVSMGHNVVAIALNDEFISSPNADAVTGEIDKLKISRIPASLSLKDRIAIAKKLIDDFNPGWVSLQFVIFGYHAKGLPFGLGKHLKAIAPGKKWSIMFHELWVAMEQGAKFKHNIWGQLQRLIIKSLLKELKPALVFTHTSLYIHELNKLGVNAHMLPLFGNIPKLAEEKVTAEYGCINLKQPLNFVLFGNIHAHTPVKEFTEEVAAFSARHKIAINLLLSGRNGSGQQLWLDEWQAAGLGAKVLGEQSPEELSALFSTATLGLSTTPVAVIEKSGSVAAMHEHGLAVLNVSAKWEPKQFELEGPPAGILVYKKGNLSELLSGNISLPRINGVATVANRFINLLQTGS